MTYIEHRPGGLEGWAECVWERRAGDGGDVARVIPDGCMDLVWSESRGLRIVGPNTRAFLAELPAGAAALGVRFHPGRGAPALGASARSLRDGGIAAADLWGEEGARLEEVVDEAGGSPGRRTVLLDWLAERASAARAPDPLVRAVVARLAAKPSARIAPLSRELGVSERHLLRRVADQVGYGPKRLGRVLRLRRALDDVRGGSPLAEAAFGAGYTDQAHFANECRELAGVSPSSVFCKTGRGQSATMRQ